MAGAAEATVERTADLVSLKGRRVLITGAASGIGRAMAIRFADAGADLILADLNTAGLEETAGLVRPHSHEVTLRPIDLADRSVIAALWDGLGSTIPDTIVNNAGIYPERDFLELDSDFWQTVLNVNLESTVWMCQQFIERRKDQGGVIVNVSSIEAILPFKDGLAAYGISKAGVLALTRSLARDYAKKDFRVNAILPGAVRTPGTEGMAKQAIRQLRFDLVKTGYDFQQRLPLGRWGQPDEIARVALFLASDLAVYVHGAAIPADGGFLST
jgi:NAD(P)-dependent dehydrogenase (short-subunit alcohol dehydrogenase family)